MKWSSKTIRIMYGKCDVLLVTSLSWLSAARQGGFLCLAQRFVPSHLCSASQCAQFLLTNYSSLNIQLTIYVSLPWENPRNISFCLLAKLFSCKVLNLPSFLCHNITWAFVLPCLSSVCFTVPHMR